MSKIYAVNGNFQNLLLVETHIRPGNLLNFIPDTTFHTVVNGRYELNKDDKGNLGVPECPELHLVLVVDNVPLETHIHGYNDVLKMAREALLEIQPAPGTVLNYQDIALAVA